MSKKIRHVLGISGGKDSAALAIYLRKCYPELDIEYYFCDTGKELEETYNLVKKLETWLGRPIILLEAAHQSHKDPFDHYLDMYRGYLPSSNSRWCTRKLKLEPFENFVGDDPVISYVGIRDDEDREGYISKKSNIQSIFPFRRNIWSEDIINLILRNSNREIIAGLYSELAELERLSRILEEVNEPLSERFQQRDKLNGLLNLGVPLFNRVVFRFLKNTGYPLAQCDDFAVLKNEDRIIREDVFQILRETVGIPVYYNEVDFEHNNRQGVYNRSRSGCYFCFFQQKIEWVWLYEQHPEKFQKALEYEKDGYTWMQGETLSDLIQPERMNKIKEDHLNKLQKNSDKKSSYLIDILEDAEGEGCAACFI
jgi:3'-phosphoadenosine 5'-phosphosulfate sulfotransferase (PAPS reductase)/FAD synthetase